MPFDEIEFKEKVGRIAAATGMKQQKYMARSKANFAGGYSDVTRTVRGVGEGPANASSGPSDLFTRTADHILIPYARAVGAEGYRFSPDLFAERFGLSDTERDYIVAALRPKDGY